MKKIDTIVILGIILVLLMFPVQFQSFHTQKSTGNLGTTNQFALNYHNFTHWTSIPTLLEKNQFQHISFSPNGYYLAISGNLEAGGNAIQIWDLATMTMYKEIYTNTIQIDFSPQGRFLASLNSHNNLTFWDLQTGHIIQNFTLPIINNDKQYFTFSPDGNLLVYKGLSNRIIFQNVYSGEIYYNWTNPDQFLTSDSNRINDHFRFSSDGTLFASLTRDGKIILINVANKSVLKILDVGLFSDEWIELDFSLNNELLWLGGDNGRIHAYEINTESKLYDSYVSNSMQVLRNIPFSNIILSGIGGNFNFIQFNETAHVQGFMGFSISGFFFNQEGLAGNYRSFELNFSPDGSLLAVVLERQFQSVEETNITLWNFANRTADQDLDGMPDTWENFYNFQPTNYNDRFADNDNDGLINVLEYRMGTNPLNSDTDQDSMTDGWEYFAQLDLLHNDAQEDKDLDGLPNEWEHKYDLNPNDPFDAQLDFDNDNLTNIEEFHNGTDPWVNNFLTNTSITTSGSLDQSFLTTTTIEITIFSIGFASLVIVRLLLRKKD